jgi:hypothetical protein
MPKVSDNSKTETRAPADERVEVSETTVRRYGATVYYMRYIRPVCVQCEPPFSDRDAARLVENLDMEIKVATAVWLDAPDDYPGKMSESVMLDRLNAFALLERGLAS